METTLDDCKTLTSQNDEESSGIRRSIAERRAAKFGFNAERINTARFRTTSPLASPVGTTVRSPCITIPPGISPTALLDSPILLPNSQISPTTGTFPLAFFDFESSVMNGASMFVEPSLKKKSHANSESLFGFSSFEIQDPVSGEQAMDFEFSTDLPKKDDAKSCTEELAIDVTIANAMVADASINDVQMPCSDVCSNHPSLLVEQVYGDDRTSHHTLEEHNGMYPTTANGRTSEDGYNWRKYGQKQVKGSEYPRSYYKCTHATCPVKKKIERSRDGQITEIIYKGAHNHPKPQPNRRSQLGCSSFDEMPETNGGSGISVKVEGGSAWKDMESGRADGLERTSSASVVTDLSDPLSTTQGKSVGTFESAETPELSSTLASRDDDDEDQVTHGSVSPEADANDEGSDSKRRKTEGCYLESNMVSRAVREPRVVVQIESEVDILDDGYRWRKYGQKVVKGNPNPRSYYKCTSAGCSVRKHVERASNNLKFVITTYEGKHNHEVPAARNSANVNTTSANLNQAIANQQPPLALSRNTTGPKPDVQLQDFIPGFDRKPVFHSDYFGTNFPGNFASDMKLGTSSIYPMKFPSMPNTMLYGSFAFNSTCGAGNLSGSISSLIPEFQFSFPTSLHTAPSLSLAGADFSNGNSIGQVQALLPGQLLIRPKEEQKDDNSYDHGMSGIDQANASSLYHHIRGNFPS